MGKTSLTVYVYARTQSLAGRESNSVWRKMKMMMMMTAVGTLTKWSCWQAKQRPTCLVNVFCLIFCILGKYSALGWRLNSLGIHFIFNWLYVNYVTRCTMFFGKMSKKGRKYNVLRWVSNIKYAYATTIFSFMKLF